MLIIYRPSLIPSPKDILCFWRDYVRSTLNEELYIIASEEKGIDVKWKDFGFDDVSQFQPASLNDRADDVTHEKKFLRKDYSGKVYDYESIIRKEIMIPKNKRVLPAVMPMWDNTPRRRNNAIVYENSTPDLYATWLEDAIQYVVKNRAEQERVILLNAWNEWGEGAYLEPDRRFGYAYLEATYKTVVGEKIHYRSEEN